MKKHIFFVLFFFSFVVSKTYADNPGQHVVDFINNTSVDAIVVNNFGTDGMNDCTYNVGHYCFKPSATVQIPAYASREILLETAVTDGKIYYGGIGFNIQMLKDDTTYLTVTVPVMATPKSINILSNQLRSLAVAQVISYGADTMPHYVVSLGQQVGSQEEISDKTFVVINPFTSQ